MCSSLPSWNHKKFWLIPTNYPANSLPFIIASKYRSLSSFREKFGQHIWPCRVLSDTQGKENTFSGSTVKQWIFYDFSEHQISIWQWPQNSVSRLRTLLSSDQFLHFPNSLTYLTLSRLQCTPLQTKDRALYSEIGKQETFGPKVLG